MPAIPLHVAVLYVAGAYLVFLAILFIYISIMSKKLSRLSRSINEVDELVAKSVQAGE